MNYGKAFYAGVFGGLIMGIIMMIAHYTDMTPLDMPMYQGSLMLGEISSMAWWVGMFSHLIISGLIAIVYAFGFVYFVEKANWVVGAVFGFIHWLIAGVFFGIMSFVHPLMQTNELASPGIFATNFGYFSIAAVLILHLIYGAVVGAIYNPGRDHINLD